jgi:hypothetical protein
MRGSSEVEYLPANRFPRHMRLYRQRVDGALQLFGQKSIYHPVPLNPRLPRKRLSHNSDSEMRFACSVEMRLMAGVEKAFVDHFQPLGLQRFCQLLFNI